MKTFNCILALILVVSAYFVRHDPILLFAVVTSTTLALLTLMPNVQSMVISASVFLNTLLMFFYFYRFFAAVPDLESNWYASVENMHLWVMLLGAFASMHILADNTCCLKRTEKDVSETKLHRLLVQLRSRREGRSTPI